MSERIEAFFYKHLSGEWESLTRWLWIYFHVSILLSTAAVGYSVARGEYLLAACYFVCPVIYFYKRYEKAKTYAVQSETPT